MDGTGDSSERGPKVSAINCMLARSRPVFNAKTIVAQTKNKCISFRGRRKERKPESNRIESKAKLNCSELKNTKKKIKQKNKIKIADKTSSDDDERKCEQQLGQLESWEMAKQSAGPL